jgi:type III pantothenate kinase
MAAPSLLLVDAGNTRLKWATASPGGALRPRGELPSQEAGLRSIQKLARQFAHHRVITACVVPRLVPLFRRAFGQHAYFVTGQSPALGLSFDYPRPGELGADRLAAAVAVQADGAHPAIIVSCGTAVAFTVLDPEGRFCGGAIAAGLETQIHALSAATAQLPRVRLSRSGCLPARSTREAIRAGALFNFQGGAKEIVARLDAALPGKRRPRLFLTGGHASYLQGVFAGAELRPLLVLEGLRIIGARLFGSSS